jgi:hypothetical protein
MVDGIRVYSMYDNAGEQTVIERLVVSKPAAQKFDVE